MDYPTANIVKNYLNLGFRGREISEVVNIPYGTLRYFMSRHGLSLRCTYSQISADDYCNGKSCSRSQSPGSNDCIVWAKASASKAKETPI
ncbi:hypothetical protein OUZ56_021653 [Daphnia magna]|uniref:Uncharacterized protein n=1 Tax=Daphnia magna TaxID=35525 RepID=A0ABR0AUB6_9CRUS|nr:hypothetical protein OUZ56_021653 [Daphnia magna]